MLVLVAAAYNRVASVETLLDMGATIDLQNVSGKTALMMAARFNCIDVLKALVARGADINISVPKQLGGKDAFIEAAEGKAVDVILYLLNEGIDPNKEDAEVMNCARPNMISWINFVS